MNCAQRTCTVMPSVTRCQKPSILFPTRAMKFAIFARSLSKSLPGLDGMIEDYRLNQPGRCQVPGVRCQVSGARDWGLGARAIHDSELFPARSSRLTRRGGTTDNWPLTTDD